MKQAKAAMEEWHAATDAVLNDWLAALKRGEDGYKYWADLDYVRPIALYAVSDYTVVDQRFAYERVVRINSSTKGGIPVVQLWRVFIKDGKILRVTQAQE